MTVNCRDVSTVHVSPTTTFGMTHKKRCTKEQKKERKKIEKQSITCTRVFNFDSGISILWLFNTQTSLLPLATLITVFVLYTFLCVHPKWTLYASKIDIQRKKTCKKFNAFSEEKNCSVQIEMKKKDRQEQ